MMKPDLTDANCLHRGVIMHLNDMMIFRAADPCFENDHVKTDGNIFQYINEYCSSDKYYC